MRNSSCFRYHSVVHVHALTSAVGLIPVVCRPRPAHAQCHLSSAGQSHICRWPEKSNEHLRWPPEVGGRYNSWRNIRVFMSWLNSASIRSYNRWLNTLASGKWYCLIFGIVSATLLTLLASVACRGCWMVGANEVLGCPREYFVFHSQNFWRPFLVVHLHFSLFSHQLSNFTRIRSLVVARPSHLKKPAGKNCPCRVKQAGHRR